MAGLTAGATVEGTIVELAENFLPKSAESIGEMVDKIKEKEKHQHRW